MNILIADDEAEIADLIAMHLEKEGYYPIVAADGAEALRAIQTQQIDLAILDIMMPKLDGLEVTRQIREQHRMPIIFVSAKASDLDKITGLVIGADDYMTKAPEGKWLKKHASKYGFILRYPKDKTAITGIQYEPWHFRYVMDGKRYKIAYVPINSKTTIRVPKDHRYEISGNNVDGIIMTVML
ncbi:response regulator [Cohnella yongneupensis]|uniref:Response regulator n=1 Tax=Cohnella yongneupensis TaxID=425006 RepID=A0ABW0QXW8_9BACL